MRRWLVIFLLTLLPLQFGWAAVAPYCAHEASPAAEHVGHHAHQHAGSPADAPKGDAGKLAGIEDLDCAQCHGVCALPLLDGAATSGHALRAARIADTAVAVRTRAAAPPERPQWLRPA